MKGGGNHPHYCQSFFRNRLFPALLDFIYWFAFDWSENRHSSISTMMIEYKIIFLLSLCEYKKKLTCRAEWYQHNYAVPFMGKIDDEKASHLNKQKRCFRENGFAWNLHTHEVTATPTHSFQELSDEDKSSQFFLSGNYSHLCVENIRLCTKPLQINSVCSDSLHSPLASRMFAFTLRTHCARVISAHSMEAADQHTGNVSANTTKAH